MNGADYRVRASHPGRPGQPLVVSNADRSVQLRSGDSCRGVSADVLRSLIANNYVERVEPAPKAKAKTADEVQE